jgi:3-phenylpropionate/trans-cinnamate dioxygenase ferredoxin subunit
VADVRVCSVHDVKPGAAKRVDVEGQRLCVVHLPARDGPANDGSDDWYVIGDECSHEDYSLSEGDVWEDDCEIECPKHGSTFDLRTGEPQTLPATQPVPTYEVKVDGDDVMVTLP